MTDTRKGPVLIDLDDDSAAPSPSEVPPVPDLTPPPEGAAMATVAALTTRRVSTLARWFWRLLAALVGTFVSIAAWNFATGLIAANPALGWAVTALLAAFLLVCVAIVVKEVESSAAEAGVDLHIVGLTGSAAVFDALRLDPAEDGVEILISHVKGVVVALEPLPVVEVQG